MFNRDKDSDKGALTPSKVRDRYDKGAKALRHMAWEYELNLAMLMGDQWLFRNPVTHVLQEYQRDGGRTRITANRLWPASRHIMSRLLQRDLSFEVAASDTDDATKIGAYKSQSILTDLSREQGWDELKEQLAWGAWLGGTSVLALDWDTSAGVSLGSLPLSGKPYGTGDVVATPLTVGEFAWEPGTRSAERAQWWVRAQSLPPADVQAMYGLKECPKADANSSAVLPSQRRLLSTFQSGSTTQLDLTLVLTYYERPSAKKPKGCVATVVGDQFVDGPKDWPFPFKECLNMVVVRETKIPGQAHGQTVFSAAVPLQAAYNASWSNIVEHLKLAGNARMLVPEASMDLLDEFTDLPAEMLPFNPSAGMPAWLSPPNLPQWVIDQPAALASQMDDVLGIHDVSRGSAPKNIESGLGISVLVEQDSTPIGHMVKEIARAFSHFGTLVLKTYEQNVKEPRKARIMVPGQVPEVVLWDGKALAGQTEAVVPVDAVMPKSKAASYAMAKEMADRFPALAENMGAFAKLADLPDATHLIEAVDADAAKAERENHEMAIGIVCVPADFDNHATHIAVVNRFRKSARYEAMTEQERQLFDMHAEAHEVLAGEQAGKAVAKQRVHPALEQAPTAAEVAPLAQPGMPAAGGAPMAPAPGSGGAPPPVVSPAPSGAPEAPAFPA